MKKVLFFLLSTALLISCEKSEFGNHIVEVAGDQFTATIEQFDGSENTKTSLSAQNTVLWSEGDELAIFQGATLADKYGVVQGTAGTSNGVFSFVAGSGGNAGDDFVSGTEVPVNVAFYPYSEGLELSGITAGEGDAESSYEISNITVPAVQNYVANSFPQGAFSMVAVTTSLSDHVLRFRNIMGALKLQLKGDCVVKSIELMGNKGEIIAGEATVTAYSGVGVPEIKMLDGGSTSIVLDCGEGVQLNSETATEFIIAVPPTKFIGGFTVNVTDTENNVMPIKAYTTNKVSRSSILKMPSLSIPVSQNPENIVFEDELVKELCVNAFDTNGDGELSYEEAAAVTDSDFSQVQFRETEIKSFDEFKYFTSVTTISTSKFNECKQLLSIEIPESITALGTHIFYECESLTEIILPDGIEEVGYAAFAYCGELSDVVLPKGLISVGEYAFYECTSLKAIDIPDEVITIGRSAFYGCTSLLSISIPSNVETIGMAAFYKCYSLSDVSLPARLTILGEYAFGYCTSLPSISIPSGTEMISRAVFYNCSSLSSIDLPSSLDSIGKWAFEGCKSLSAVVVPEKVKTLARGVFLNCESLSYVTMPNNLKIIDTNAFSGCSKLSTIAIPEGVKSIGAAAFYSCSSLASLVIPSGVTSIENSLFANCSSLTSLTIPDGLTSIGVCAFSSCSSLSLITIPEGVTYIGGEAFLNCSSLTSLTIPEGVTDIKNYTFYGCSSLVSLTIPERVNGIYDYAFSGCSSLVSLTIPEGVTYISDYAFSGCLSLKTCIIMSSGLYRYGERAFDYCSSLTGIYVPAESVDTYKAGWPSYAELIQPIQ